LFRSTPEAGYDNCLKSTREYVRKTQVQKAPEILGREIYVFAYYYDRAEQAGLLEGRDFITVGDYANAAKKVCAIPSSELGEEHWKPWQCLDLCYIYSLLHDGYGLRDEQKIYVSSFTSI
jgi:ectonucleoside triphosphate diphosphohydrolase 5/6